MDPLQEQDVPYGDDWDSAANVAVWAGAADRKQQCSSALVLQPRWETPCLPRIEFFHGIRSLDSSNPGDRKRTSGGHARTVSSNAGLRNLPHVLTGWPVDGVWIE